MKKDHIENEKEYKHGVCLQSEIGKAHFFHWLSYIAKVNTKNNISQTYSTSRLS
jgi:hypothetical protein